MNLIRTNKQYMGKVEAYEVCLMNGHELPTKGVEVLHSRQVGLQCDVVGKDKKGYYIEDVDVKALILR